MWGDNIFKKSQSVSISFTTDIKGEMARFFILLYNLSIKPTTDLIEELTICSRLWAVVCPVHIIDSSAADCQNFAAGQTLYVAYIYIYTHSTYNRSINVSRMSHVCVSVYLLVRVCEYCTVHTIDTKVMAVNLTCIWSVCTMCTMWCSDGVFHCIWNHVYLWYSRYYFIIFTSTLILYKYFYIIIVLKLKKGNYKLLILAK